MNFSDKSSIYCNVIFAIICIAALSRSHNSSADAFVPQTTILTHKQKTVSSPMAIFPNQHPRNNQIRNRNILTPNLAVTTSSDEELHNEINSMKAKDIRQELQSYGISTKSFFEKSELVDALVAARKEGRTPVVNGATTTSSSSGDDAASSETTTSASSGSSSGGAANRQERLNEEMEKCKTMKVGELKKELESYGVSTKSFFEKSEFVRAVAEARVDGVKQTSSSAGSAGSGSRVREEPRDPSYRDVTVSKFSGDKALLGRGVIDVKAR